MITAETPIRYDRKKHNDDNLIAIYKGILKPRMIEEKMLILLRQGKISKWFSGIGQEAGSVGAAMALEKDEFISAIFTIILCFVLKIIIKTAFFSYLPSFCNLIDHFF